MAELPVTSYWLLLAWFSDRLFSPFFGWLSLCHEDVAVDEDENDGGDLPSVSTQPSHPHGHICTHIDTSMLLSTCPWGIQATMLLAPRNTLESQVLSFLHPEHLLIRMRRKERRGRRMRWWEGKHWTGSANWHEDTIPHSECLAKSLSWTHWLAALSLCHAYGDRGQRCPRMLDEDVRVNKKKKKRRKKRGQNKYCTLCASGQANSEW